MALTRPVLALRRFIVLALPLGACIAPNPGFIFETDGAPPGMTDVGTTTVANSVGTDDAGSTDAVPTTDGSTSSVVTSTTVSTLPSDTTSDASNTDATNTDTMGETTMGETSSGSSTGVQPECEMQVVEDFFAVDDAFFIAGASGNEKLNCLYYDPVIGSEHPCRQLNFGSTPSLRVARMEGGIDAMFAVRFPGLKLVEIVKQGNQVVKAELVLTFYGEIAAQVDFGVGMIMDQWVAGEGNGTFGAGGESNFEEYLLGFLATPWTGDDGPRGASVQVATLTVPKGFGEHEQIASTPIDIAPWLADPVKAQGLVVYIDKNFPVGTFGPGLKALESGIFQPRLRVTYCKP